MFLSLNLPLWNAVSCHHPHYSFPISVNKGVCYVCISCLPSRDSGESRELGINGPISTYLWTLWFKKKKKIYMLSILNRSQVQSPEAYALFPVSVFLTPVPSDTLVLTDGDAVTITAVPRPETDVPRPRSRRCVTHDILLTGSLTPRGDFSTVILGRSYRIKKATMEIFKAVLWCHPQCNQMKRERCKTFFFFFPSLP